MQICTEERRKKVMKTFKTGKKNTGKDLWDQKIREAGSIAICGHIRPDGDSIGAALGLCTYILDQYPDKEVDVYLEPIAEKFSFLRHSDRIRQTVPEGMVYDLFISVDCSDTGRFEAVLADFEAASFRICVDHHVTNTGSFAELNFIEPDLSSACEVLADLFDPEKISLECAEALFTGLVHDTGVFRHSNTSGKVMRIAGMLLDKGVNGEQIINDTFFGKTYRQNLVMGRALLESILMLKGKMIFSIFRKKDFSFYGVGPADLDGIVSQMMLTEGVECAMFLYQTGEREYKVSLRSTDRVDVSAIAGLLGGGGHKKAAGCTVTGEARDIIMHVAHSVEQQLYPEIDE